jgi:hypothetical protein
MAQKDNPSLWEHVKDTIMMLDIAGTRSHEWSARKAQLAVKLYKELGGGYIGNKSKNNSLTRWTNQHWQTKSGLPSSITHERYLPHDAIEALTPQQYLKTSRIKKQSKSQYSKQPYEIAEITKNFI